MDGERLPGDRLPSSTAGTPPAEVDVTIELVQGLLAAQHPDLEDRDLAIVANGWDNVIVRIGSDLVARLPRRELAAALVGHEHRWLPKLAAGLPIPVPVPLRVGVPGAGYPWAWSICQWFDGDVAADVPLADPAREADRLGAFVHALHRPAPAAAPRSPFRGLAINELIPRIRANLDRLHLERTAISGLVDELAATSPWRGPGVWLHGDLHSANLLVADGEIAAVLDFGDLTAGDPAVDLAVAWMLFQPGDRFRFRVAAGGGIPIDEPTWNRARLWGVHFALIFLQHSADNVRFARMGERLLRAVAPRPSELEP